MLAGGWFREGERHALAARGIRTGTKWIRTTATRKDPLQHRMEYRLIIDFAEVVCSEDTDEHMRKNIEDLYGDLVTESLIPVTKIKSIRIKILKPSRYRK